MANHQRTAADVAQLESDNEYYRTENERLERELAIMTADRNRLQVENAMVAGNARENLVKATRMETILRQVSHGLVAALSEVKQEREVQAQARRAEQEKVLTEETGHAPAFLRRNDAPEKVREAAERIAPSPPPRVPQARIDHTLASRDSRLPPAPEWGPDADQQNLETLADRIATPRGK